MHNPFSGMSRRDWALWLFSLTAVLVSNVLTGKIVPTTLAGTLIGVTALIFMARGDVWGQILTIVFSILYGITSWSFRYWGEMITYLGMTLPMAALATISWMRNPYKAGEPEVAIHRLSAAEWVWGGVLSVVTTVGFYFILRAFDTPNLFWSTLSVTTSFLAAYLTARRSPFYALAYAGNDLVLILLWVLMAREDPSSASVITCFAAFLANDLYGFVSWRRMEKRQSAAA